MTGLFDLAVFAEHLQSLAMQLLGNVVTRGAALAGQAEELAQSFISFSRAAGARVLSLLRDSPLETIRGLIGSVNELAVRAANAAGHSAGRSLIESLEAPWKQDSKEGFLDILTTSREGETLLQPLGLASSKIERVKAYLLDTPWTKIGYEIGYAVGAVAVNIALFVSSSGIGNVIVNIGGQLGKLVPVLRSVAGAVQAAGRTITLIDEAISLATQAVLKLLAPLMAPLEQRLLRLRAFLRRLLGLSEEAGLAAAGVARQGCRPGRAWPGRARLLPRPRIYPGWPAPGLWLLGGKRSRDASRPLRCLYNAQPARRDRADRGGAPAASEPAPSEASGGVFKAGAELPLGWPRLTLEPTAYTPSR